jgi:hypothetical protein
MRMAVVNRVHSRVGMRLQGRQGVLRQVTVLLMQLTVLELMRRNSSRRRIARTRCAYDIRVLRAVHIPKTRRYRTRTKMPDRRQLIV